MVARIRCAEMETMEKCTPQGGGREERLPHSTTGWDQQNHDMLTAHLSADSVCHANGAPFVWIRAEMQAFWFSGRLVTNSRKHTPKPRGKPSLKSWRCYSCKESAKIILDLNGMWVKFIGMCECRWGKWNIMSALKIAAINTTIQIFRIKVS